MSIARSLASELGDKKLADYWYNKIFSEPGIEQLSEQLVIGLSKQKILSIIGEVLMKLEKIEKCKLKILLTYKLCKNSMKKESILKSQKINIQNITDGITGIEFYKDVKLYERERDYISFDIDR